MGMNEITSEKIKIIDIDSRNVHRVQDIRLVNVRQRSRRLRWQGVRASRVQQSSPGGDRQHRWTRRAQSLATSAREPFPVRANGRDSGFRARRHMAARVAGSRARTQGRASHRGPIRTRGTPKRLFWHLFDK